MIIKFEDTEFAPGDIVVADGSKRRMLIMSTIVGFATCLWFVRDRPHRDIFHMSDLTLDKDQHWRPA